MTSAEHLLRWFTVYWPRPLTEELALRIVRTWAADQRSPVVVLEASATGGLVTHRLGSPKSDVGVVRAALEGACPGVQLVELTHQETGLKREPLETAARVHASTRHRSLDASDLSGAARALLQALARARRGETLTVQVILGPRRIPLAIPNQSPSSIVMPWWQVAWMGNGGTVDPEKRTALRAKVAEHGFACLVRVGAVASSARRRELLVLGAMAALRQRETPGLQLRLVKEPVGRINRAALPWRWPLRLGVHEVLAVVGWPVADARRDADLPGLAAAHPVPLLPGTPSPTAAKSQRVLAVSAAPGTAVPLTLPIEDQLRSLHVLGPTGVGKSTMLANLALADISDDRGLVVIDPKGDLVDDILARIPPERRDDIVVLDPADTQRPVGFNPLNRTDDADGLREAELAVDGLLAVFRQLWADSWGPRTQDVLHASLLTLIRRPDASLVMLPLLLTNAGFRRSLVQTAVQQDPIALGPFWAWYERLTDGERSNVVAPVMNKLRPFLLRPSIRAMLGQTNPSFHVRQVFTEQKVLLVSLSKGLVGQDAAALIGSLVVAELWRQTLQRAAVPAKQRRPVHLVVDEVQDYLHLPTDLADALAQARGLGVGFTLAHQYLAQLPKGMSAAIGDNVRSRLCFQLAPLDAVTMAKGHPELEPVDFGALGAYEVYASLHGFNRPGASGPYVFGRTLPLGPTTGSAKAVRAHSRERFGQDLGRLEAGFHALAADPISSPEQPGTPPGRRRRTS